MYFTCIPISAHTLRVSTYTPYMLKEHQCNNDIYYISSWNAIYTELKRRRAASYKRLAIIFINIEESLLHISRIDITSLSVHFFVFFVDIFT